MIKKAIYFVAFAAFGLLSSCEHSRLVFSGDPDTVYHKTLRSLTQYQKLFALDEVEYQTYVTYMSSDLAEKYVDEYSRVFALNDAQKNQMLTESNADQAKYDDFMVAHYASATDNADLTKNTPDSVVWKFYLENADSTNTQPLSIEKVSLGSQREYFYPHVNAWTHLYRIRFAKTNGVEKKFIMKGPIREVTFLWKL